MNRHVRVLIIVTVENLEIFSLHFSLVVFSNDKYKAVKFYQLVTLHYLSSTSPFNYLFPSFFFYCTLLLLASSTILFGIHFYWIIYSKFILLVTYNNLVHFKPSPPQHKPKVEFLFFFFFFIIMNFVHSFVFFLVNYN